MKKTLLIIAIAFTYGCKKEETKKCYQCESVVTKYRTPWIAGYPKTDKDRYESCTDETISKRVQQGDVGIGLVSYTVTTNIKCTQNK